MDKTKVEYKVHPEHGIVVATINYCRNDAVEYFTKQFLMQATSQLMMETCYTWDVKKAAMPKSFKAVARCHAEDTFDEETGKRIALSKLTKKYHNALCKRIAYINESLIKATKLCEDYLEKLPK